MPATRQTGVKSRPLPDWYSSDLVGANRGVAACPGHYQMMGVFNNATDGSILKVYALDLYSPAASDFILLSLVYGQAGAAIPVTYGSIDPFSPSPWGIAIALSSSVRLGSNIGGFLLQTGVPRFISTGFPLAIVQPSWSFLLQANSQNTEIDTALWWLPCKS